MSRSFRHSLLGLSVIVMLAAACAAPTPTATPTKAPAAAPTPTKAAVPSPTPVPVKITIAQTVEGIVFGSSYIARARYFKEEGIDAEVVLTGSGAKTTAALVGGSAQFATPSLGDGILAIAGGQPLVALASTFNEVSVNVVMHKEIAQRLGITYQSSEEAKIKAFKGLKVGITSPGSLSDQMTRHLLKKYNLDPEKDVEIVAVGADGVVAGLAARKVDGYVMTSPQTDASLARGDAVYLFKAGAGDFKEFREVPGAAVWTRKDYLEKNPDVVKRVMRAVVKGAKLIKENPEEAKGIIRSFFPDIEPAIWDEAWKTNQAALVEPAITKIGFENNVKLLKAAGREIPPTLTFEQVVNATFVENAKKEVGFK